MTNAKIAVIGLGIMGHGIADNFLKNGYQVAVWNRTSQKAADLIEKGAVLADSVKDAVQSSDIIFEVTASDDTAKEIWLNNGIVDCANSSQALITCATLSIEFTQQLAEQCKQKQLTFFDMPMTGGSIGAQTGQLTLLVGGDEHKLEIIKDDLNAIAKDVKYFGPVGSGMKYKLILNAVQAVHVTMFGEAMRLAKAAGLDQQLVGDALVERPGGISTIIARDSFQHEPEAVSFSVDWIAKDLAYATKIDSEIDTPLLNNARKTFNSASKNGLGTQDWTVVNKN